MKITKSESAQAEQTRPDYSITFDETEMHSILGICEQAQDLYQGRTDEDLRLLTRIFQHHVKENPGQSSRALELFAKINKTFYSAAYHGPFAESAYTALRPVIDKF